MALARIFLDASNLALIKNEFENELKIIKENLLMLKFLNDKVL